MNKNSPLEGWMAKPDGVEFFILELGLVFEIDEESHSFKGISNS